MFDKGVSGNPKGRPKGAEGKLTRTIRETVLETFNELQKDKKTDLRAFAKRYPRDFMIMASRLIPTEVNATLAGKLEIITPSWFDKATDHILPVKSIEEAVSN